MYYFVLFANDVPETWWALIWLKTHNDLWVVVVVIIIIPTLQKEELRSKEIN